MPTRRSFRPIRVALSFMAITVCNPSQIADNSGKVRAMLSFSRRIRAFLRAVPAFAFLTAFAATIPVRAQKPPDQAATFYPVHGVVLNSLTHEPIPRVLVENNSAAQLTDGDGRFELSLPEGTVQISIRRPGYNARGQDQNHIVKVGPNTPELTFYLTPQATITGHVSLSTGEPADGITFLAYRKAIVEGRERWEVGSSASTDSEGTFRMANLATPGLWVLCSVPMQEHLAAKAVMTLTPTASTPGYPSVCYPGPIPVSGDAGPANALTLAPGQQAEVEIALTREAFHHVAIGIPNAVGVPAVGVDIRDSGGRALEFSAEWNSKAGLADFFLPSGQYYAEARSQGQINGYGRLDFRVGEAAVTGLSMMLLPSRPISVEIHKEFTGSSNPQDRFMNGLNRNPNNPGLNINLIAADSAISDMAGGGLSQPPGSGDASLFQLDNVVPGRYWVLTYPYEGYVSTVTSGGSDLSRQPLIVGPGNSTAPIQVTLRNNTGQIQCTINAQPATEPAPDAAAPGATAAAAGEVKFVFLYAIPTTPTSSQIPQTQGQGSEAATFSNLAPGTYRVVAYDRYQQINLSDPQQLAEIASRGQTVTVSPGATASIQLDLIHANSSSTDDGSDNGGVIE